MFISDRVRALSPYIAGEQPADKKFIKLNTNENPYPPSEGVYNALKSFDAGALKLYPDPNAVKLREVIAEIEGVKPENVFAGNGSDEVLAFAFYALFDTVAFFDITYSFYPVFCRLYGIEYETLTLKEDFTADTGALAARNSSGLVLANPNAPTTLSIKKSEIEKVIKNTGYPVLIDEAYIDFASEGTSAAPLVLKYENLLVVKTLSKSYSLAGLRCGYALGDAKLITALEAVRDSFNSYPLDALCQALAASALNDRAYHAECCKKIIATRTRMINGLQKLGVKVLPSETNFVFISAEHLGISGQTLYLRLRESGILVRHFSRVRIDGYVRVSVGTDADADAFITAVENILKSDKTV